ncbi:MAG: alginate export family protein, partial [Planctomycetota bacterium]|nr:alginate export family protein [Planctomycetota bacterium]
GSTVADTAGVDLKRAFASFHDVGGAAVTVDIGRFVLAYGDQRLIGHLEWFDQGRTYDGIRARRKGQTYWVDMFAVRIRETVTPDDDQWLAGFYGNSGPVDAYILVFGDSMSMAGELISGDTLFLTIGVRMHRKRDRWDYTAEFAIQVGDHREDDLEALAFVLAGGYTFDDSSMQPRLGIEVAFASGDDNPADGDQGTFQTLFPTNHLHYGRADLVGWGNLLNVKLVLSAKLSSQVKGFIEYHHFRVVEEAGPWVNAGGGTIRTGAPGVSKHLGDEIDVYMTYAPKKNVTFLFKFALFLPGGFVNDTGPDETTTVFYLQTHVKF